MTKKKDPYRSFPEVVRADEKEERKDGLIARRERQELTDLHPAPFCAFLNEAPSFDAFFLPTLLSHPTLGWGGLTFFPFLKATFDSDKRVKLLPSPTLMPESAKET